MLPAQKLKYQVIKEKFFNDEIEFLRYTRERLFQDEYKKLKRAANTYTTSDCYSRYEDVLSNFYDTIYNKFFEKTNEDLFLSFWKEKDTKSLAYDKEFYRLMGSYDMKDSKNKIYGTYFIMYKFKYNKKRQCIESIKNYYFLTLDEIKNRYIQLSNEEYIEQINAFKQNNK